jgi:hypothetical protein
MKLGRVVSAAFAYSVALWALEPVARAQTEGVPAQGFLLEVGIGGTVPLYAIGNNGAAVSSALPSLMAGYRLIDRLQLQLGFVLGAFGFNGSSAVGGTSATASTFTIVPQVAVDLLKYANNRVAFYAEAGLPLGANVSTITVAGNSNTNSQFVIGFDVGLGVRYALAPIFTIGFESGILGIFAPGTNTNNSAIGASTAVTFYASAVATLYFGK